MVRADLDKRAELMVWPARKLATTARAQAFPTLREALAAAADLALEDAQPWISTESGDILSTRWVRAKAASYRLQ